MFWPDGGMTPFHGEKATNWEGGFRVPCVVRWPGHIKPGQISNDIVASEDWMPTLLGIAGEADAKEKLLTGMQAGSMTYKVHLDGYNHPHFWNRSGKPSIRTGVRASLRRLSAHFPATRPYAGYSLPATALTLPAGEHDLFSGDKRQRGESPRTTGSFAALHSL